MNMCGFYNSTIGKKIVVAVTGLMLFGFTIAHMAGNFKALAGFAEDGGHKLDHYAVFLRTMGEQVLGHEGLLWALRLGLIAAFVLHVVTIVQLVKRNKEARPVGYKVRKNFKSTLASRVMAFSGAWLFIFIVLHLLHLTLGKVFIDDFRHGEVYHNIYISFKQPAVLVIYLLAMLSLSMHVFHGVWSVFQTLGVNSPDKNKLFKSIAITSALVLFLGFMSVPASIYFGMTPKPSGVVVPGH